MRSITSLRASPGRLRLAGLAAAIAASLAGCASVTPAVPAPQEVLGPGYLLAAESDLTGDILMVAVKPSNRAGKLHLCGVFLHYGEKAREQAVHAIFYDDRTAITLGRPGKDDYAVRLHPSFMSSAFVEQSPVSQDELSDLAQAAHLPAREAGCADVAVPWRQDYATAPVILGLPQGQATAPVPVYVFVPTRR